MTDVLLVALGGALGALLRWGVGLLGRGGFPWPTLVVNVAGSVLLGAVAHDGPAWALTLLGSGVAGALTTYSAFALDTVRLPRRTAAAYVVATLVLGARGLRRGLVPGLPGLSGSPRRTVSASLRLGSGCNGCQVEVSPVDRGNRENEPA